MASIQKRAGLALALLAATLAAVAPAEAQRQFGDRFRRDRGADIAVAGLAGLAVGAVIASNNNRFNGPRFRGRGFYGPRQDFYDGDFYGPRDDFYDRGFYGPRRGFYDQGFYGPRRGFYGPRRGFHGPRCFVQRQWDPYFGGPVRVRVCR